VRAFDLVQVVLLDRAADTGPDVVEDDEEQLPPAEEMPLLGGEKDPLRRGPPGLHGQGDPVCGEPIVLAWRAPDRSRRKIHGPATRGRETTGTRISIGTGATSTNRCR